MNQNSRGMTTAELKNITTIARGSLKTWLCIFLMFASCEGLGQTMNDPLFASAMEHIEKGEWKQAEGLLKYQLAQNPNLHRARIELALIYVHLGRPELAKFHFDKVLSADKVPDNVQQNISQMLAMLDNQDKQMKSDQTSKPAETPSASGHRVESYLQLALGLDNNVRFSAGDYFLEDDPFLDGVFIELEEETIVYVAPDGYVYDVNGNRLFKNDGTFNLGDPDKENTFAETKLAVEHGYQFNRVEGLSWHNLLDIQATENTEFSTYNKQQYRLKTGFKWQPTAQFKTSVYLSHRLLKRDGQVQIRASGFEPELTYYNELGSWTLGLEWMDREYEDTVSVRGDFKTYFAGFDTQTRGVSVKWSRLFWDDNLLLLGKLEYFDSNASDGFDYQGYRALAAAAYDITDDMVWSFSASKFLQDYSEISDNELKDKSTTLRSRVTYSINSHVDVFLAAEHAVRSSDIYGGIDSDKTSVKLGIKLSF